MRAQKQTLRQGRATCAFAMRLSIARALHDLGEAHCAERRRENCLCRVHGALEPVADMSSCVALQRMCLTRAGFLLANTCVCCGDALSWEEVHRQNAMPLTILGAGLGHPICT